MYRVKVKDQDVAVIESPKSWGELFKVGDRTVFPPITQKVNVSLEDGTKKGR